MHYIIMTLILAAFWVLATEATSVANWLLGSLVGLMAIVVGREHPKLFHRFPNLMAGMFLVVFVTYGIVRASLQVAWLAVRPNPGLKPSIVAVPLDVEGDFPVMLFANLVTLTPGTLSVALDDERRTLYVHNLTTENEAEAVRKLKDEYERPIIKFFGK